MIVTALVAYYGYFESASSSAVPTDTNPIFSFPLSFPLLSGLRQFKQRTSIVSLCTSLQLLLSVLPFLDAPYYSVSSSLFFL